MIVNHFIHSVSRGSFGLICWPNAMVSECKLCMYSDIQFTAEL